MLQERETFVLLKPFYNFAPLVLGMLLQRHVEYYQVGGASELKRKSEWC